MAEPYAVDVEEVEYLRHGDKPLLGRVFKPRGKGPFPAVVEAHGGAWAQGNRAQGALQHPAGEDRHDGDLERRASRRAGGKPDHARYAAIPLKSTRQFDARGPFVVTLWPVICAIGRRKDPVAGQSPAASTQAQYWLTEAAMSEGSPNLALQRGDKVELPDILYLQHAADTLHPRSNLDAFVAGYRKAGGTVELHFFDPAAKAAVAKIVGFIRSHVMETIGH